MINPVNPKRKKKRFESAYGSKERVEWIRGQRCYVTGQAGSTVDPIVPSHVKTKATGGGPDKVIPMLLSLEKEYHNIGHDSFEEKYEVDLFELADLCDKRWQAHLERTGKDETE